MTPDRAALVALMNRYLGRLMDSFVSLLEVHKLTYCMQEAGDSLRLQYVKGIHGPYSGNLGRVLDAIEYHLVSGCDDGDGALDNQLELLLEAIKNADSFLANKQDTLFRFARVNQLIESFETPSGLEFLATMHQAITHENATGPDDSSTRFTLGTKAKRNVLHRARLMSLLNPCKAKAGL